ncbi:MAG: SRPBCC domain-containing protein [Phenylobacterium sp.]
MMPFTPPPPLKASLFARSPGPAQAKGPPAPKGPSGVRIEDRIGVQASAETIWDLIVDLKGWEVWNPLYPKASGQIRIGQPLDLTLVLPGQAPRQIQPVVLEWVPNEQLHWRLSMMGGLVKTVRYLEIEPLAPGSCIVSNGEIFGGLMGPPAIRRMGRTIQRGFREMNEALKARAEAIWAART